MTPPNGGKDRELPTTPSERNAVSQVELDDTELDRTELDPWHERFEQSVPDLRDIDGELLEARMLVELFGYESREVAIGQYVIERRLGHGGMGEVYAGRDVLAGHEVAIKLLRPTGDVEADRLQLIDEARALAKSKHPNVIALHHIGEHDGRLFIAMERIDGPTLAQWQLSKPRLRALLRVYAAAARGLAAAHRAGVVHRDFKPSNVLLADDGRVLVSDFGVASVRAGDESLADERSSLGGTLLYMAPERVVRGESDRKSDSKSDQFSFFSALFQAVYGVSPVPGSTRAELLANLCAGRIVLAPKSKRRVPSWLKRAFERGLSLDPQRRFDSMDEVAALLERRSSNRMLRAAGSLSAALLLVALGRASAPELAVDVDPLAEVWSEPQREALVADEALAGPRLASAIDQWANEWRSTWRRSFLRADTQRCLDDARERFAVLVEQLRAGGLSKQAAFGAVAALPAPRSCVALIDGQPVPKQLPADQRDAISQALMRAELARLDHRFDEAASHAKAALELAERGRWRSAQLDALELLGLIALADHAPLEALASLEAAREQMRRHDFAEAERTLDRAIATLDRGQLTEPHLEIELRRRRADAIAAQGRAREQDALLAYEQTIELARGYLGEGHLETVEETKLWSNAGVAAHDRGQVQLARILFDTVLARRRVKLGERHPLVASSLIHLAYTDIELDLWDDALARAREALEILSATDDEQHLIGEAHGISAMAHGGREDWPAALAAVDRAIAACPEGQATPELAVQRAMFLGALGRGEEAIASFQSALLAYEAGPKSTAASADLIEVWIAWLQLLHEQKNSDLAASEFERITTSYDIETGDLERLEQAAFPRASRPDLPTTQEPR